MLEQNLCIRSQTPASFKIVISGRLVFISAVSVPFAGLFFLAFYFISVERFMLAAALGGKMIVNGSESYNSDKAHLLQTRLSLNCMLMFRHFQLGRLTSICGPH